MYLLYIIIFACFFDSFFFFPGFIHVYALVALFLLFWSPFLLSFIPFYFPARYHIYISFLRSGLSSPLIDLSHALYSNPTPVSPLYSFPTFVLFAKYASHSF